MNTARYGWWPRVNPERILRPWGKQTHRRRAADPGNTVDRCTSARLGTGDLSKTWCAPGTRAGDDHCTHGAVITQSTVSSSRHHILRTPSCTCRGGDRQAHARRQTDVSDDVRARCHDSGMSSGGRRSQCALQSAIQSGNTQGARNSSIGRAGRSAARVACQHHDAVAALRGRELEPPVDRAEHDAVIHDVRARRSLP